MDDTELDVVYEWIQKRIKERKLVVLRTSENNDYISYESYIGIPKRMYKKDITCMFNNTCRINKLCSECDDYYIENCLE